MQIPLTGVMPRSNLRTTNTTMRWSRFCVASTSFLVHADHLTGRRLFSEGYHRGTEVKTPTWMHSIEVHRLIFFVFWNRWLVYSALYISWWDCFTR